MKFNSKMQFGFNAVVSGQKSATVNAAPSLTACSTKGKFVVTSPVTKALKVAVGENIMFLNNISNVEQAIAQRTPDILAVADEMGVDIDSREGQDALLKSLTVWLITKGIAVKDSKNQQVTRQIRMSDEEKREYITKHAAEFVAAHRDDLIERNGGNDADDKTLSALIDIDEVNYPSYDLYTGSKTSTAGTATGVGCQVSFTDTTIWSQIKSDIDSPEKKNRVFDVKLDNAIEVQVSNGFENVTVVAYPIEFVEDSDPIVRGQKDND